MNSLRIPVPVNHSVNVENELDALRERIALRAYERFLARGEGNGCDLEDWYTAEADLMIRPNVELHVEKHDVIIHVGMPNVDPASLKVSIAPNAMLVTYLPPDCELEVLGVVRFQSEVDLDGVEAEYVDETLKVVAPIAENREYRGLAESVA